MTTCFFLDLLDDFRLESISYNNEECELLIMRESSIQNYPAEVLHDISESKILVLMSLKLAIVFLTKGEYFCSCIHVLMTYLALSEKYTADRS